MRKEAEIKRIDNLVLKKRLEIEKLLARKRNLEQGNPCSLKENYKKARLNEKN